MKKLIVVLGMFFAGCAADAGTGNGDDGSTRCVDGRIEVKGPVLSVLARFPAASPPSRLLEHSMSPGMLVTPVGDGWLEFVPSVPIAAGDTATITTRDYSADAPVCPLEVVVDRE